MTFDEVKPFLLMGYMVYYIHPDKELNGWIYDKITDKVWDIFCKKCPYSLSNFAEASNNISENKWFVGMYWNNKDKGNELNKMKETFDGIQALKYMKEGKKVRYKKLFAEFIHIKDGEFQTNYDAKFMFDAHDLFQKEWSLYEEEKEFNYRAYINQEKTGTIKAKNAEEALEKIYKLYGRVIPIDLFDKKNI